jgi:hypothetical protein
VLLLAREQALAVRRTRIATILVGLDPHNVLGAAEAPLGQTLAPALELVRVPRPTQRNTKPGSADSWRIGKAAVSAQLACLWIKTTSNLCGESVLWIIEGEGEGAARTGQDGRRC